MQNCHHGNMAPMICALLMYIMIWYLMPGRNWSPPPPKISRAALGCTQYAVAVQCITRNFSSWMNGWSMELATHLHPILQSRKDSTLLQNQFYLYITTEIFCPPNRKWKSSCGKCTPCWWSLLCKCNNLLLVAIWASTLLCHFYSLNINTTVQQMFAIHGGYNP